MPLFKKTLDGGLYVTCLGHASHHIGIKSQVQEVGDREGGELKGEWDLYDFYDRILFQWLCLIINLLLLMSYGAWFIN